MITNVLPRFFSGHGINRISVVHCIRFMSVSKKVTYDHCTVCGASEQYVTSSLYGNISVHDADPLTHADYDANIVGWYATMLIFYLVSLLSALKNWFC